MSFLMKLQNGLLEYMILYLYKNILLNNNIKLNIYKNKLKLHLLMKIIKEKIEKFLFLFILFIYK